MTRGMLLRDNRGGLSPMWGIMAASLPQAIGDVVTVAAMKSPTAPGVLAYGSAIGLGLGAVTSSALMISPRTRAAGAVGLTLSGISSLTRVIVWAILKKNPPQPLVPVRQGP